MIFGILFLLFPILELALFVRVAGETGFLTALFLCFASAIIGGALVRRQGFSTLVSIQTALDQGEMPVEKIFDGMCLFVAGALFILPGFLSDFLGALLLIPPVRTLLRRCLGHYLADGTNMSAENTEILDVEFTRIDEDNDKLP